MELHVKEKPTIKASLHKAHGKPLMTEPQKPMAKIADGVQTAGTRRGTTGTAMAAKRVRGGGVAMSYGTAAALGLGTAVGLELG